MFSVAQTDQCEFCSWVNQLLAGFEVEVVLPMTFFSADIEDMNPNDFECQF